MGGAAAIDQRHDLLLLSSALAMSDGSMSLGEVARRMLAFEVFPVAGSVNRASAMLDGYISHWFRAIRKPYPQPLFRVLDHVRAYRLPSELQIMTTVDHLLFEQAVVEAQGNTKRTAQLLGVGTRAVWNAFKRRDWLEVDHSCRGAKYEALRVAEATARLRDRLGPKLGSEGVAG